MRKMLVDGDVQKIQVLLRVRKIIFKSVNIVNKLDAVPGRVSYWLMHQENCILW